MKDRRLKIGMTSMNIVASWGSDIGNQIIGAIPDGTKILKQNENFERATLDVLLYNDEFEKVEYGCLIPRMNLDVKFKDPGPQIIAVRS